MAMKCEKCGVEAEYPNFKCKKQPGNHTVPSKTYYHLGGSHVANMRDRQMFSPLVILKPGQDTQDPATGQIHLDPGVKVEFSRGQYSTTDAEQQFYLDAKKLPSGESGLKQWRATYYTPDQNRAVAQAEYEDLQRKIEAGNALLEAQKAAKDSVKAKANG